MEEFGQIQLATLTALPIAFPPSVDYHMAVVILGILSNREE